MNRIMTIRIGVIVVAAVIALAVGISLWNFSRQDDKYTITEETIAREDKVSVDFSQYPTVFTPAQESEIQANLLTRSTKDIADNTKATGTIRESSFVQPSEREILLIIDSSELQTSYLISRFIDPDENLDILNITCVDESQRIYKKDYCLAE